MEMSKIPPALARDVNGYPVPMGTDSMIFVPAPLDKYDTLARPVPSWVPTMRITVGIEVSMGIHGYPWIFDFIYFLVQIITFF